MSLSYLNEDSPFSDTRFSFDCISSSPEINIIKKIKKARYTVYLVRSPFFDKDCALKLYPFHEAKPSQNYINEARFSVLHHPNIISILKTEELDESLFGDKMSYILMEYAKNGDLQDAISLRRAVFDEKLARTYLHQIINALEYLHESGFAHLDISPKNLLFDENYQIKIADFDLSYKTGDEKIRARGTKYFRAPEILFDSCKSPRAADIFSVGIILFYMISGGKHPQTENVLFEGINLFELMNTDQEKFWAIHCKHLGKDNEFFSKDFKELFNKMTCTSPEERASIAEVKEMAWYNGPIYNEDELKEHMKSMLF